MVLDEHRQCGGLAGHVGDVEALLLERQLASHDDANALALPFFLRADDAVEAVAIGDRDGVVAELGGAEDHELGRRGPGEEAEVGARRQLDVPARSLLDGAAKREELLRHAVVAHVERVVRGERHAGRRVDADPRAHEGDIARTLNVCAAAALWRLGGSAAPGTRATAARPARYGDGAGAPSVVAPAVEVGAAGVDAAAVLAPPAWLEDVDALDAPPNARSFTRSGADRPRATIAM